jgi:type I restriction enzyme S subunit
METTKQISTYQFLKFISFKDFILWDVKRYTAEKIQSVYKIEKLKYNIKQENHKVKPFENPENEFKILGVNNKTGIFDAYIELGKNIKQPYKKVEHGFLAYNPYRVNVGSIGLRTEEHQHEYISPAYVVFSCKETLMPDFLYKIFKTERYNKIIRESTTGSVRQNLTYDILEHIKIPIPPIETQTQLLAKYYYKIHIAEQQEQKANNLEKSIDNYLFNVLEIKPVERKKHYGLQFTNFKKIGRWGVDYILNQGIIDAIEKGKYRPQTTKNFITYIQYGTSSKANIEKIGIPVLRMNNIVNSELDLTDLKHIKLNANDEEKLILDKGDLLFNRTNSKELVGKTAIFEEEGKYTFASYLIRVKLNPDIANEHYINYLFNSKIGRLQIDMVSRQILGQANVNSQELQDFIFPIPPLKIQNQIANTIKKKKEEIKRLKIKASRNRENAIREFEKKLFKVN